MINVTQTFLPPFDEYATILKRAWEKAWITNNGELLQELELKLKEYLGVKHLFFCGNGTVVLQMALKALNITKEVITTPFSYVATTNSILWEGATPVFVDIEPRTFCIDADKIEASITENTEAILATHVYGLACNIDKIHLLADKYRLKVIYDGAHAFGATYKGRSLLSYGDISTCSFHATKLFHTVEGGCIICKDDELAEKLFLFRQFCHSYDDFISVGINGKNSEFHAAMGLANLPYITENINRRKQIALLYHELIPDLSVLNFNEAADYNFSYYPVLFENEMELLQAESRLIKNGVKGRRYFYPSLNSLPFVKGSSCPVSEDISKRIYCLPIYPELNHETVHAICSAVTQTVSQP